MNWFYALVAPLFLVGGAMLSPMHRSHVPKLRTYQPVAALFSSHSYTDSAPKTGHSHVPVIKIAKAGGPLVEQLKRQADSAAAHKQVVLVDIGASWCSRCREFEATLSDPVMVSSLKKARLIYIDYDIWQSDLINHGFMGAYDLPDFFLLTRDGGKGESFERVRFQEHADSVHPKTVGEMMGPPLGAFVKAGLAKMF